GGGSANVAWGQTLEAASAAAEVCRNRRRLNCCVIACSSIRTPRSYRKPADAPTTLPVKVHRKHRHLRREGEAARPRSNWRPAPRADGGSSRISSRREERRHLNDKRSANRLSGRHSAVNLKIEARNDGGAGAFHRD